MQDETTAAAIVADGTDDTVDAATDRGRGDQIGQHENEHEHERQEEERRMSRDIPWQMEWKHPQWITSSSSSSTEKNESESENYDAEVVGITSARLSNSEIVQILAFGDLATSTAETIGFDPSSKSFGNGNDHHYLLTVTLLGRSADKKNTLGNDEGSTAVSSETEKPSASLASEVLLEVLDVPSSNPGTATNTNVIHTKRLRWPESIFDGSAAKEAHSHSQQEPSATKTRKKAKAKRKNLLASVFLPLLGIDEENEYVREDPTPASPNQKQKQPNIGIVSATLCRRPEENLLARTRMSATKDIVELISFGTRGGERGGGMVGHDINRGDESFGFDANAEYSKAGATRSYATQKEDDSQQGGIASTKNIPLITETSSVEDIQLRQRQQQSREVENFGKLSFVCVSRAGEVFVYDPIKLLLGIEDTSGLQDGERDAKKGLEEASSFFFGQELFQNLQETWKPLAEPSNRIHLSLFEHDRGKNHSGANSEYPFENLVQSNQELSDWAQSILSRENKSTGSSKKGSKRNKRRSNSKSIGSGGSLSTFQSADGGDSSTIMTSATDALTVVQTMAMELQTGVDEALSMLPYLLNPLLEPSTLKDRTVRNMPLAITVTGSAYVVVTGSGYRRKTQQKNWTKLRRRSGNADGSASLVSGSNNSNTPTSSSRGSPRKPLQDGGQTLGTNEAAVTVLSSGSSGDVGANEQEALGNPLSEMVEESKDDSEEPSPNDPHFGQNESFSSKNNEPVLGREPSMLDAGDNCDMNGNDNYIDYYNDEGTNKTGDGNEKATERETWWDKDSAADQEDNTDDNVEVTNTLGASDDNKLEGSTEKSAWWKNDSPADQDGITNDKDSVYSQVDVPIKNNEENNQRHYFDVYDSDYEGDDMRDRGGFVTFLSTVRWSETRTLFLPFVPVRTSHISQWNGMELLWVIGEFETLLIRMDSTGPVPVTIGDVMGGGETSNHEADLFSKMSASTHADDIGNGNELSPLSVKMFQILPIDLCAMGSIPPRLLCASNTGIDPPSILELHVNFDIQVDEPNQPALVLLKTLGYCTPQGTVVLRHAPSHVAKVVIDQDVTVASSDNLNNKESISDNTFLWAEQGQGWSLVGSNRHIQFICWEGSTLLRGAYVQNLTSIPHQTPYQRFASTHILPLSATRDVPLETISSHRHSEMVADEGINPIGRYSERDQVLDNPQLFSSAIANLPLIDEFQPSLSPSVDKDGRFGGDIFSPKGSSGAYSDLSRETNFSRRQTSEYLLQQCSSWTQLEDTLNDRIVLERQDPVLCLRSGKAGSPYIMLTLRQLVVNNGTASPFEQVLAWLAKRNNFFVAAGIALDLLQDADSLYHLWKHAEMIDEEDEETKLGGLLDGIAPVRFLDGNRSVDENKHSVTVTHLSEMTIGCFIKGGATMAKTLVRFLEINKSYDPARVSLMLSLTTMDLFSDNTTRIRNFNACNSICSNEEEFFDELLWPIKCLLTIGTEREYLNEILALLNNTIPDELRHRHPEDEKEKQKTSILSLTLTKRLIKLILESDPLALDILMNFHDDRSGGNFWLSLEHDTCLALSLMNINSSFPFLTHSDARAWARGELDLCFQGESDLPTIWLQELSLACLWNASCDLDDLRIVDDFDGLLLESANSDASDMTCVTGARVPDSGPPDLETPNNGCRDNRIGKIQFEIAKTRNALLPSTDTGHGIDHDLLIPTLLLLEVRNSHWRPASQFLPSAKGSPPNEELSVSTQSLLNAVCYLAGRTPGPCRATTPIPSSVVTRDYNRNCNRTDDKLFAEFDGKSAMKQCFRANNVVAGAYLIGGTNGFILHVCDVLNRGIGISISDAESFLLNDRLNLAIIEDSTKETATERSSFELTEEHLTLLLLLDETVLGIKTFGDFDFVHNRGRVDPVFAARSILRAWLSLCMGDKAAASSWLGDWLGERLEIRTPESDGVTPFPKTKTAHSMDTEDSGTYNPKEDRGKDPTPKKHRLACASLARSLLWPNNKATPKTSEGEGDANSNGETPSLDYNDSLPLAATMEFEKKLLMELCQSCLGLIESVPSAIVREIQI